MAIKRKAEDEIDIVTEKKSKLIQPTSIFSLEKCVQNLSNTENSFLALSEFNEHVRRLTTPEQINESVGQLLRLLKPGLDDILALITDGKRKASENITLYRFLTSLLEFFANGTNPILGEVIVKKFVSTSSSMSTVYFMLSSQTTASHLKITLRLLLAMVQQNDFCARSIFTAIDFKRTCWKPLLRRRDVRDPEDVRFCLIKFFFAPLVYQHVDTIRTLIKEHNMFHDILGGLVHDSRAAIEFVLDELRTHIVMVPGVTKTDKLHLFDDRNLKSLLRLYHWTGERRQKEMVKNKKKKTKHQNSPELENEDEEEMEVDDEARGEIRRLVHTFLVIVLNSKNYGINFFDATFGSSTRNANPIILKVISNLSNNCLTDEYAGNLITISLTACPDLLQPFFKSVALEFTGTHLKNATAMMEFVCEVLQQQKPIDTWLEIFRNTPDSVKLTDMLINLTLPMEIMNKFDHVLKNNETTIQVACIKFLSVVLQRVKAAMNILTDTSLICDQTAALECYQQALLRFLPKPDHFCESLNLLKNIDSMSDIHRSIREYLDLLELYSSSCFMSMPAMNVNLDVLLSSAILHLLTVFKRILLDDNDLIDKYFDCFSNILNFHESIDDAIWARQNKDLGCTPIRMLLNLAKQSKRQQHDKIARHLATIIIKFSSINNNHANELLIWFYTWLRLDSSNNVDQFLSICIEKIILNPYPLLEKTIKSTEDDSDSYSLMIYAALDSIHYAKEDIPTEIDEYLCHVLFRIYIGQRRTSSIKINHHLRKIYLKNRKTMQIFQLLNVLSSSPLDSTNEIVRHELATTEKSFLSTIDLQQGPDSVQIYLAVELNIFKLFSSKEELDETIVSRLIADIVQCLNIVLLLRDSHRSFERLFDTAIEHIQARSTSNPRMFILICQIIDALNIDHFKPTTPLRCSSVLLKCVELQPNNPRLLSFVSMSMSPESRLTFLELVCNTVIENVDILRIVISCIREEITSIKINDEINYDRFLETIIDGLSILKRQSDYGMAEALECLVTLLDKMEMISTSRYKSILRQKQKNIFKLTNKIHEQQRLVTAQVFVRTLVALRSDDRKNAIDRLLHKSQDSLVLLAHVFHNLFLRQQTIPTADIWLDFLRQLLSHHPSEPIVFDLLRVYCDQHPDEHNIVLELLQNDKDEQPLPMKETNRLLLILKLFPDSIATAETIYRELVPRMTLYFESTNQNEENIDEWLDCFEECTRRLLAQVKSELDLFNFISYLLKHFSIFTTSTIRLLKTLVQFLVTQEQPDTIRLAKLFANLLKHKNFLEQLSSSNRTMLVDTLALLVSQYDSSISSIVSIDCSKHFPMLLSIYTPTLSEHDQHTLACMYMYEKRGYSMQSAFVWGEAALELYSKSIDAKSRLLPAPKLEQIITLLDDRMMKKSILHFPVTRRLRTIEPQIYEHGDEIYDPTYLIPVFYHSLGSGCVVKCQGFVEKHCLAYCLMALSSRCGLLRAVVYNCLARFEQHLMSQRFYCKEQLLTMLLLLKQSIKKTNLKLAPIVALFLAKLADLFTHPESKMYRTISRFLLKQPFIDLVHIPLFAELFHSPTAEYKQNRAWILHLVRYGIKDTIDYTLCAKAYVFKMLMTFYNCSLCDDSTKLEILHIFHSTSKVHDVIMPLLFDYGFLPWLQATIKDCPHEGFGTLSLILQNLCQRLASAENQVQLLEFDCVLMLFVRRLRNETTISSFVADTLLSTLVQCQQVLLSSTTTAFHARQRILKSPLEIEEIKHVADCSTTMKNVSLLSCFC